MKSYNTAGNVVHVVISGTDIISESASPSGASCRSPIRYTHLPPTTVVNSDNGITDVEVPYILTQMSKEDMPNAQQPPVSQVENYLHLLKLKLVSCWYYFEGYPKSF